MRLAVDHLQGFELLEDRALLLDRRAVRLTLALARVDEDVAATAGAAVLVGDVGKGAQRWLDLGIVRFQPSELVKLAVPLVVRLEGTNVEKGREILNESGLKFTVADGMKDAAEKVVALSK